MTIDRTQKESPQPPSAQLEFGDLPIGEVAPELRIASQEGAPAPFDPERLGASIIRVTGAGEALGVDATRDLARAVGIHLRSNSGEKPVSPETVRETAGRVLEAMGYPHTASTYLRAHGIGDDSSKVSFSDADRFALPESRDAALACAREWLESHGVSSREAAPLLRTLHSQIEDAGLSLVTGELLHAWLRSLAEADGVELSADALSITFDTTDIARVLAGLETGDGVSVTDPRAASDRLAGLVSRRFAASTVYSRSVVDAIGRGVLDIHGMDRITGMYRLSTTLEPLKSGGLLLPDKALGGDPAADFGALMGHWSAQSEILERFAAGSVDWLAVNYSVAPWIPGNEHALEDAARTLLFEAMRREDARVAGACRAEIHLNWDPPETLAAGVLESGGGVVSAEEIIVSARNVFAAIARTLSETASRHPDAPWPHLVFHLSPYFFGAPECGEVLACFSSAVNNGVPISLRYAASEPLLFDDGAKSFCETTLQRVMVDLARASLGATTEAEVMRRIDRAVDTAVLAHRERLAYLDPLLRLHEGPLALLQRVHGGNALVHPDEAGFELAVCGLAECVGSLTGDAGPASEDGRRIADAILQSIRLSCDRWSDALGRRITLAQGAAVSGNASGPLEKGYAPSDRFSWESELHPLFSGEVAVVLTEEERARMDDSIEDFIRRAFLQTPCRGLFFV